MQDWKKRIFVNAVKTKMKEETKTAAEVLETYPALTQEEKDEILTAVTAV